MKDTTGQEQPKKRGRRAIDAPELRVVGIDVKPAPDAEERLRRLFTILARVVEDAPPASRTDPAQDEGEDGEA